METGKTSRARGFSYVLLDANGQLHLVGCHPVVVFLPQRREALKVLGALEEPRHLPDRLLLRLLRLRTRPGSLLEATEHQTHIAAERGGRGRLCRVLILACSDIGFVAAVVMLP